MKKRIYGITTALCLVLCIILCIAFAAVCSKAENSKTLLPEVRNNGTAIQWRDTAEEECSEIQGRTTHAPAPFCVRWQLRGKYREYFLPASWKEENVGPLYRKIKYDDTFSLSFAVADTQRER